MPKHIKDLDQKLVKRLEQLDANFKCQQCGNCCREQEGIGMTGKELLVIAKYIGVPASQFRRDFIVDRKGEWLHMSGHPCPFLLFTDEKKARCMIWSVRPSVCKNYPFFTVDTLKNSTVDELVFTPHKLPCPEIEPYLNRVVGPKKVTRDAK